MKFQIAIFLVAACLAPALASILGEINSKASEARTYASHAGEELYRFEAHQGTPVDLPTVVAYIKTHKPIVEKLKVQIQHEISVAPASSFNGRLALELDLFGVVHSERLLELFAAQALCYRESICTVHQHQEDSPQVTAFIERHRSNGIKNRIYETDKLIQPILSNPTAANETAKAEVNTHLSWIVGQAKFVAAELEPVLTSVNAELASRGKILYAETQQWAESELQWFHFVINFVPTYQKMFNELVQ